MPPFDARWVKPKNSLAREQCFNGHEEAPRLTRHPHFPLQHAYKRYSALKAIMYVLTGHQDHVASVESVQSLLTKAVERYE